MAETRTIDNLGIGTSIRYAEDQTSFEKAIISESQRIAKDVEITVTVPSFLSETNSLFQLDRRNQQWAFFRTPERYGQQKGLFTYQMAPSLGSSEKLQSQSLKIDTHMKELRQKRTVSQRNKNLGWEEMKEGEDEMKESRLLIHLLEYIQNIDKALTFFHSRRGQYQRG